MRLSLDLIASVAFWWVGDPEFTFLQLRMGLGRFVGHCGRLLLFLP